LDSKDHNNIYSVNQQVHSCLVSDIESKQIDDMLGYDRLNMEFEVFILKDNIDTVFCYKPYKFLAYPTSMQYGGIVYSLYIFKNRKMMQNKNPINFFKIFDSQIYRISDAELYYSFIYEDFAMDSYWIKYEVFKIEDFNFKSIFKDDIVLKYNEGQKNEKINYNSFYTVIEDDSLRITRRENDKYDYNRIINAK
jgi:hypothetical protein